MVEQDLHGGLVVAVRHLEQEVPGFDLVQRTPGPVGLLVFDAYRPWSVTQVFWDATPPALREFVADPARGSRHNRGCAVDLSLYERNSGQPVAMPSEFDEFTPRAYPDYPGGTARQRYHRERLRRAMEAEGFTVHDGEWWHFDHADWRCYPVSNAPLR
jgi:D-alanyl-D-alanine dipeptidase